MKFLTVKTAKCSINPPIFREARLFVTIIKILAISGQLEETP